MLRFCVIKEQNEDSYVHTRNTHFFVKLRAVFDFALTIEYIAHCLTIEKEKLDLVYVYTS